jgi:hypothetical protein
VSPCRQTTWYYIPEVYSLSASSFVHVSVEIVSEEGDGLYIETASNSFYILLLTPCILTFCTQHADWVSSGHCINTAIAQEISSLTTDLAFLTIDGIKYGILMFSANIVPLKELFHKLFDNHMRKCCGIFSATVLTTKHI